MPHGVGVGPFWQFKDQAIIRALDVLPQPLGPLNKYAWWIFPDSKALDSGVVTCSWPITSAKIDGRYLRYSASDITPPNLCLKENFALR